VILKEEEVNCALCDRETPWRYQEKHHLIPKSKKGKITTIVCNDCGNQIHRLFTLKELKNEYNTIDKLKSDPRVKKWINWIRKQKKFNMCHKKKKKRR